MIKYINEPFYVFFFFYGVITFCVKIYKLLLSIYQTLKYNFKGKYVRPISSKYFKEITFN